MFKKGQAILASGRSLINYVRQRCFFWCSIPFPKVQYNMFEREKHVYAYKTFNSALQVLCSETFLAPSWRRITICTYDIYICE